VLNPGFLRSKRKLINLALVPGFVGEKK